MTGTAVEQVFHWEGGKSGTTSIEDLHAAGVPVRPHPSGETKGELVLYAEGAAAHLIVKPGAWIGCIGGLWGMVSAATAEAFLAGPHHERDPLPGLMHLHLTRVGYRRWFAPTGTWHFRSGGLTVVEMEEQGWEPLYVAHAPERAAVEDSSHG